MIAIKTGYDPVLTSREIDSALYVQLMQVFRRLSKFQGEEDGIVVTIIMTNPWNDQIFHVKADQFMIESNTLEGMNIYLIL